MQSEVNLNAQGVNMATSQMAQMSLSGGALSQAPPTHLQAQLTSNQIAGTASATVGQLPLPNQSQLPPTHIPAGQIPVPFQTAQPIVPSSLNLMQHPQQDLATGVQTGMNSNPIQSPLSPLANNAALFGQNFIQSPLGQHPAVLQQQNGSPIASPSTPPTVPNSVSLAFTRGLQNPIGIYTNMPTHHDITTNNNTVNLSTNQLLSHQQQLQLLQQNQLLQQQQSQFYQANPQYVQQQQQLSNQTLNNINFQALSQGHNMPGMTSIPSTLHNISNSIAQMTMTTPFVSSDFNPNVNTLPHDMPTTLNPSLKNKPIRNVLNSSSGSMSPMSPRNGLFQDSWEIYEDSNTSGVGSSISSPMSPGSSWSEYVIPRYDAPKEKDQCLKCNEKVYAMEKVGPIRDVLYHKNCFTCVACGTKLSLKNFHHNPNDMDDYNVFCASHKPRVVNIASEGNAVYVTKTSPRIPQMDPRQDPNIQYEPYYKPIPKSVIAEEEENFVEVESTTATDQPDGKPEINNEGDISNVVMTQISQSNTPSCSRKSNASNSESSPFSSVSSSSSYATSLKTEGNDDFDFKPKDNGIVFTTSYVRSDRPSSMSSISTTSSTENIKMKAGPREHKSSADQQETSSIASNSSIERPDRPSCFQRSVSTVEQPCNPALSEMKKHGKTFVKSYSSQDFTHNNLKAVVEPRRLLPRNESMRMDRPSQYH